MGILSFAPGMLMAAHVVSYRIIFCEDYATFWHFVSSDGEALGRVVGCLSDASSCSHQSSSVHSFTSFLLPVYCKDCCGKYTM